MLFLLFQSVPDLSTSCLLPRVSCVSQFSHCSVFMSNFSWTLTPTPFLLLYSAYSAESGCDSYCLFNCGNNTFPVLLYSQVAESLPHLNETDGSFIPMNSLRAFSVLHFPTLVSGLIISFISFWSAGSIFCIWTNWSIGIASIIALLCFNNSGIVISLSNLS